MIDHYWRQSVLICLVLLQAFEAKSQCKQTYSWASWQNLSSSQATGTIAVGTKTVGVTITANYNLISDPNGIYRLDRFSGFSGYNDIPKAPVPATEWSNNAGATTTICFSEPVTNPIFIYTSLGRANPNDIQKVTLKFSDPYTVVYDAGGTTFIDAYSLSGLEGNAIIEFPGTFKCITIYSEGMEYNTTLNLGLMPPPFPVTIADDKGCGKVTLTAQGGATYQWNGGDNPTSATNTVRTSGVYSVTATDKNGCTSIALKPVTIAQNGTLATTITKSICKGESYLGYQASGTYTDTFKTAGGCDSVRTLNLSVLDIPVISMEPTVGICTGQTLAIKPTVTPSTAQLTYQWSTGATSQTISVGQSNTYSLTVTNGGTCSSTASTRVVINPNPTIKPDERVCLETSSVILYSGAPAANLTYRWDPTNSTDSTVVATQPGSYSVTVISQAGCQSSRTITVRPMGQCSATVFAPDLFTPNGDQVNDHFNVIVVGGTPVRLTVFDRWGSVIYSEENSNPRWDGTYKGDMCLTGVYSYVLTYKSSGSDETLAYRSKITLLR